MNWPAWERRLRFLYRCHQQGLGIKIKLEQPPGASVYPPVAWTVLGASMVYTELTLPPGEPILLYSCLALRITLAVTKSMTKSKCHSGLRQSPCRGRVQQLICNLEAEYKCQLVSSAILKNSPASDSGRV